MRGGSCILERAQESRAIVGQGRLELEHLRDEARDAKLAPWRDVREAHDKVATLLTVIERVKFPPKAPRAPREPRPERFSSR